MMTPQSGQPRDALEGQIVDEKYRIERLLGQGGFGRVYKARHLRTDTLVVLKFLLPNEQGGFRGSEIARFRFEAEVPARIRQGVIKCLDFYLDLRGGPCLVTEFIDGPNLSQALKVEEEGKLELVVALRIAAQIAQTIAKAHELSVVHRDLTPKNVLLPDLKPDPSRVRVKIIDWGIAREFSEWVSTELITLSEAPSQYAPPETGKIVHPPADVFSFGILLYEMLVGRLPEPRTNADPTREHDALFGLDWMPRRVRRVLSRSLALDPAQRMRMDEIANEINKALEEELDRPRVELTARLHQTEHQVHSLTGKLELVKHQSDEKDARLQSVLQKLAQQSEQFDMTRGQLQKTELSLNELRSLYDSHEQAAARQTKELESASRREQEALYHLNQARQQATALEVQLTQQRERLEQSESEVQIRQREIETLRRELHGAKETQQQLGDALRAMEARQQVAEERAEEQKRRTEQREAENQRLVSEYAKAQAKFKATTQDLERSSHEGIKPLQEQLTEYEQRLDRQSRELQMQRSSNQQSQRSQRRLSVGLATLGLLYVGVGAVYLWPRSFSDSKHQAAPPCPVCVAAVPQLPRTQSEADRQGLPPAPSSPAASANAALVRPTPAGSIAPAEPKGAPAQWQMATIDGLARERLRLFDVWPAATPQTLLVAGALCESGCGTQAEVDRGTILITTDDGRSWRQHPAIGQSQLAGRLYRGLNLPADRAAVVGDGGMLYWVESSHISRMLLRRPNSRAAEVLRGLWGSTPDELSVVSANPGGALFEVRRSADRPTATVRKLPTGDSLYSAWGNDQTLWVVGTGGSILRQERKSQQWKNLNTRVDAAGKPIVDDHDFETLYQVAGSGPVVVACGAIERSGQKKGGVLYVTSDLGHSFTRTVLAQPCYALAALPGQGFLLAGIGDHMTHLRPDGRLEPIPVPGLKRTDNAKGVWGRDLEHLFVVGWDGLLLRRGRP